MSGEFFPSELFVIVVIPEPAVMQVAFTYSACVSLFFSPLSAAFYMRYNSTRCFMRNLIGERTVWIKQKHKVTVRVIKPALNVLYQLYLLKNIEYLKNIS